MTIEFGTPVFQVDGSYRLLVLKGDPALGAVIWGTYLYWAHQNKLFDQRFDLKTALEREFPWLIFVDDQGCSYRLFPQKAALAAVQRLRGQQEREAQKQKRRIN